MAVLLTTFLGSLASITGSCPNYAHDFRFGRMALWKIDLDLQGLVLGWKTDIDLRGYNGAGE